MPELIPLGQINHLAFGPGNAKVIGRNTADPARWKRYRGGTAGHLWIDVEGSGAFRRMSALPGNITSPMWIGNRIYYLNDVEGVGNLYSCRPDGSDQRRHTDHDDFYARHAQTDGRRIVWSVRRRSGLRSARDDDATRNRRRRIDRRRGSSSTRRKISRASRSIRKSASPSTRGKPFTFAL
jgi:tricorn protease